MDRDWLPLLLTVSLLIGVDALFSSLGPPQGHFSVLTYVLTLAPAVLFWAALSLLRRALGRRGQIALAAIVGLTVGGFLLANWHLYFRLGEYLATWMIRFMNDEPSNWHSYWSSYILRPKSLWFLLPAAGFFAIWFPWQTPRPLRLPQAAAGMALCLGTGVFTLYCVDWYLRDTKKPIDTATLYALGGLIGRRPEFDSLTAYPRARLPEAKAPRAKLDVVIVVVESWARSGLAFYGDPPGLMPSLEKRLREESRDWVVFHNAFTNATYTDISIASFLTSIATDRPNRPLFEAPLLWDWTKTAGMWSVLVTSQRLEAVGLPRFFATSGLDMYVDQSILGYPLVNDLGMDDLIALDTWERLVRERPHSQRILALFGSNALHTPYQTQSARLDQPSTGTAQGDALRIVDKAIERIVDLLGKEERYDNTLFILLSDHGDHLNHPRGLARAVNFHDEVLRIPFLVKAPKRWRESAMLEALRENAARNSSNLDLLPTVLDALDLDEVAAFAPHLSSLEGSSLLRRLPAKRWILATNSNGNKEVGQVGFALIRDSERLVCASHSRCRFYDVQSDPKQETDLLPRMPASQLAPYRDRVQASQILRNHVRRVGADELR